MDNPAYYAIIPADVRYDKNLTANSKLMYGEITALCNEKGFCWATNKYFAKLYGRTTVTISKWINQLKKYNYIDIVIIYKPGTKEILSRRMYIATSTKENFNTPTKENFNTPTKENFNRGIKENFNRGIKENFKDNNTRIINTSINIINSSDEELEQNDLFGYDQSEPKELIKVSEDNYKILYNVVKNYFLDKSPDYFQTSNDFKREGVAIKVLCERAIEINEVIENQKKWLNVIIGTFNKICKGQAGKDLKYAKGQIFIPSRMMAKNIWPLIVQGIEKLKKDKEDMENDIIL